MSFLWSRFETVDWEWAGAVNEHIYLTTLLDIASDHLYQAPVTVLEAQMFLCYTGVCSSSEEEISTQQVIHQRTAVNTQPQKGMLLLKTSQAFGPSSGAGD